MADRPAQTFQRLVDENRELLEKLQANQREMEQLANYMLSLELESQHGSVKPKSIKGDPPSEFGRRESRKLALDSVSSAKSDSQKSNAPTNRHRARSQSVHGSLRQTSSATMQELEDERLSIIRNKPSGDSMTVNPPEFRPNHDRIRYVSAPRPVKPHHLDASYDGPPPRSALEARGEFYAPDERWYLSRR